MAEDALIKAGLAEDPVIQGLLKIRMGASWKATLQTWNEHAADNGRVHPLLAITTISGRMSSREPNGHGLPKDSTFRAIVKAGPGKMIIKADYSQIELRIEPVLAVRELHNVKEYLAGTREHKLASWIRAVGLDLRHGRRSTCGISTSREHHGTTSLKLSSP
jgi:DNA polymerase I-like protein with 3'-5' exonuclease and polymerase domains